jgi:Putative transcription activator
MRTSSICDRMRADSAAIWNGLHAHPFIQELAAGTLAPEKFRFFLEQDDLYLEDYARCLAMGVAKSRDDEERGYFLTDLNMVFEAELPSNRALLQQVVDLGAEDRGGALTQAPATLAYTSYMQSLALRGGPLEIMAALLPCAWSYAEIAERLRTETPCAHPVYAGWIEFFSLPENLAMVEDMRERFDRLAESEGLSAHRHSELGRIFATSSRLEREFWEMSYTTTQWPDLGADLEPDMPALP